MSKISHDGFTAELKGKILTIKKIGESRKYDIKENNSGIEHKEGEEYFYIRTDRGFYYQFKFEVDDGFVGDKYSNDDEFIDTFACFTFGE
jgi:hypothetical protein